MIYFTSLSECRSVESTSEIQEFPQFVEWCSSSDRLILSIPTDVPIIVDTALILIIINIPYS